MPDLDMNVLPEEELDSTVPVEPIEPVEPFLKIDDKTFFNTPDEVIKAFKEGTMRHSDYNKSKSEIEQERIRHDNAVAEYNRRLAEDEERYKPLRELDKEMKSNPTFAKEIQTAVARIRGNPSGEDVMARVKAYVDEQYGPQLSRVKEQEKREKAETEFNNALSALAQKYPDTNKDALREEWANLMGPEANMVTILELIHHAIRGRGVDPSKIEKDVIAGLEAKKGASMPSSRGATVPPPGKLTGTESLEDIADSVKLELGG